MKTETKKAKSSTTSKGNAAMAEKKQILVEK